MTSGDEDDNDLTAAERVIGLLTSAEARDVERRVAKDDALAASIARWESRLHPLNYALPPRPAPADVWPRINLTQPAVAALSQEGTGPAYLVVVGRDGHASIVTVGVQPQDDFSLELWGVPEGQTAPIRLTLLPMAGPFRMPNGVGVGATLLVSREPKGSAPGDAPTGPVILKGQAAQGLSKASPARTSATLRQQMLFWLVQRGAQTNAEPAHRPCAAIRVAAPWRGDRRWGGTPASLNRPGFPGGHLGWVTRPRLVPWSVHSSALRPVWA